MITTSTSNHQRVKLTQQYGSGLQLHVDVGYAHEYYYVFHGFH